jgi:hypothetical protein
MLWIVSGRIAFMLIFLWIMRAILNGLTFVRSTTIPDLNLRMTDAISLVVFIAVLVLLFAFIAAVSRLWPAAFPRFPEASAIINTILYLILFNQLYKAAQQLIPLIAESGQSASEALMFVGVGLVIFALALVIRAFIITYQALPRWLASIQFSLPAYPVPQAPQENVASRN